MDSLSVNNRKDDEMRKSFSLKKGFYFFIKANLLLICMVILFLLNRSSWGGEGNFIVGIFIGFNELFLIPLSIVACFKPQTKDAKSKADRRIAKNEWIGAGVAFIATSILSLVFLAVIPYPSTLLYLILITNFMVAAFSVIFHNVAIGIYEANVYSEHKSVMDYTFKYIAVLFSGLNYCVQITLLNLPLIINKLVAVIFVLLLLWQSFMVGGVFD